MAQERIPQHRVVPPLVEEQLPSMTETQVRLTVLVNVGRAAIRARLAEEVEDAALANVEEEADVLLASAKRISTILGSMSFSVRTWPYAAANHRCVAAPGQERRPAP